MCLTDRFSKACRVVALVSGLAFSCAGAHAAALLTLAPTDLAATGTAGQTIAFRGAITNRTTVDLSSTDLILNIDDFDPLLLEPTALLGITPFVVSSYSMVDGVALFSVTLAVDAMTGLQTFRVMLQDIYGNFSDPVAMTIDIVAVPEPSAWMMLCCGALVLALLSRRAQVAGALFSHRQET